MTVMLSRLETRGSGLCRSRGRHHVADERDLEELKNDSFLIALQKIAKRRLWLTCALLLRRVHINV